MAQKLVNLNTKDYEHPFDRVALERVNAIPLMPKVINFVMNWAAIRWKIVGMCGSNFHVTKDACPDLFALAKDVTETLDLKRLPNLYMEQDYYINAYTTGYKDDAFIVCSTGAVDRLDDDELKFVIGHESGHVKSGHVLYHVTAAYIGQILSNISGAELAAIPIQGALTYWNRMSEFTADRAGLLACQDLNAALRAIMKMSGLPQRYYGKASLDGFMKQAREFDEEYGGTADKIIRTISILDDDHPWTIVRAAELIRWVENGEYQRILDGTRGKTCKMCGYQIAPDAMVCPRCGSKDFE